MKAKEFDEIKKEAEILANTEMEVLIGGQNTESSVLDSCGTCCGLSNGGISTPIEKEQRYV